MYAIRSYYVNEMENFVLPECENEQCSRNSWMLLQIIKDRLKKKWNLYETSVKLSASFFYLNFPSDIGRTEEVIDMIDSALQRASDMKEEDIIFAADYVKTREEHIDELLEKQKELEAVKVRNNFV